VVGRQLNGAKEDTGCFGNREEVMDRAGSLACCSWWKKGDRGCSSVEKIIAGYCSASRVEQRRAEVKKESIGAAAVGVDWLLE
jgi:hypothetical protein